MPALTPGNLKKLHDWSSDDPEISMPPKGGRLFDDEIEILEKWIANGAHWPGQMNDKIEEYDHWAFKPVERSEVSEKHPILLMSLSMSVWIKKVSQGISLLIL